MSVTPQELIIRCKNRVVDHKWEGITPLFPQDATLEEAGDDKIFVVRIHKTRGKWVDVGFSAKMMKHGSSTANHVDAIILMHMRSAEMDWAVVAVEEKLAEYLKELGPTLGSDPVKRAIVARDVTEIVLNDLHDEIAHWSRAKGVKLAEMIYYYENRKNYKARV